MREKKKKCKRGSWEGIVRERKGEKREKRYWKWGSTSRLTKKKNRNEYPEPHKSGNCRARQGGRG